MSVGSLIVIGLICGIITMLIGQKNIDTFGSFVIGALLGLIGIVIMLCCRPNYPRPQRE